MITTKKEVPQRDTQVTHQEGATTIGIETEDRHEDTSEDREDRIKITIEEKDQEVTSEDNTERKNIQGMTSINKGGTTIRTREDTMMNADIVTMIETNTVNTIEIRILEETNILNTTREDKEITRDHLPGIANMRVLRKETGILKKRIDIRKNH